MRTSKMRSWQLYVAMACFALISLGGCSSGSDVTSDVTCVTQNLTNTASVGLKLNRRGAIEIVSSSDEGIFTLADVTYDWTPRGFALGLDEDEAMYGWIWNGDSETDPMWLKAANREGIEATRCQLGRESASVVVANGSVILIKDEAFFGELLLDKPPANTRVLIGRVSIFDDPS